MTKLVRFFPLFLSLSLFPSLFPFLSIDNDSIGWIGWTDERRASIWIEEIFRVGREEWKREKENICLAIILEYCMRDMKEGKNKNV